MRLACYGVMVWCALWAEGRPAPHLPDLLVDHLPYVPFVDRYNYWLWLLGYVPVALWLWWTDAARFCRYMVTSGSLALARGACILVTGLGPVRGDDVHQGQDLATWSRFLHVVAPATFFDPDDGARVSFTKDLFFSGHTATTFLLLLYVWRWPKARGVMGVAHVLVVASVFLAHLHYTIDVVGAYAITFSLYVLREGRGAQVLQ